jgi:hypothetical protein
MSEEGEDNHEWHWRVELRGEITWEVEENSRRPYMRFSEG